MKDSIYKKFLEGDIKIKSKIKLRKYINYCIENNNKNRLKGKTSFHHILPKVLFPTFNNLKENEWNGSHLTYANHYYAHWLLTEAIDDYSQLHAFTSMHNRDTKNGRITEDDLIPASEFQLKMEERSKQHSLKFTGKLGRAKAEKAANTMSISINDELSIREKATLKTINTKSKMTYKEKNRIANRRKDTIGEEGFKKIAEKSRNTQIKNTKRFNILNENSEIIYENLHTKAIYNISQGLLKSSKEHPLGSKRGSKTILIKNNKEHLIGLYIEELT